MNMQNCMKKLSLSGSLLLMGLLWNISLNAQEVKNFFVQMPDSILTSLTAVNRADCIDFLESKMRAKVDNRFGRTTEMIDLGKDYIFMQMTSRSTWQMKVLAVNDSVQVICTIATVCAPVCDSQILFYTTSWKELPSSDFIATQPVVDDFFITPDSASSYDFNNNRLQIDMSLIKADLSKNNDELAFILTTPEYVQKETAEKLQPFLRRSIVYSWKDGMFQKLR